MAWSNWLSDQILDNFRVQPGTVTIVRPGNIVNNPMTRMEAEHVATAIRERAATRKISVDVTTQPINGEPRYANVVVRHIVDQTPAPEEGEAVDEQDNDNDQEP